MACSLESKKHSEAGLSSLRKLIFVHIYWKKILKCHSNHRQYLIVSHLWFNRKWRKSQLQNHKAAACSARSSAEPPLPLLSYHTAELILCTDYLTCSMSKQALAWHTIPPYTTAGVEVLQLNKACKKSITRFFPLYFVRSLQLSFT